MPYHPIRLRATVETGYGHAYHFDEYAIAVKFGRENIGVCKAVVMRRDLAERDECSLADCDEYSVVAADIAASIFDRDNRYRKSITRQFPSPPLGNVLYVRLIELKEDVRGQGFGLVILERVINLLSGGCSFVAASPAPPIGPVLTGEQTEAAIAKLARHWGRMGFVKLRWAEWYVCPLFRPRRDIYDVWDEYRTEKAQ